MLHFHLVTLLDLTLTFTYFKVHIYTISSPTPEKAFGKVWVATVITPVSVADKPISDGFDL